VFLVVVVFDAAAAGLLLLLLLVLLQLAVKQASAAEDAVPLSPKRVSPGLPVAQWV